jgi:hypothetical protein
MRIKPALAPRPKYQLVVPPPLPFFEEAFRKMLDQRKESRRF